MVEYYYSLNRRSEPVTFEEATLKGQAPDKGLYFPDNIPQLPRGFIRHIHNYSKEEIGTTVMAPYTAASIPETVLADIIKETVNFDFPLVPVTDNMYSLELFHGPTLAFKDVGARFMSRCLGYFNRNSDRLTTVLVATSGDTGGAVANGFLGVDGVEVIILYPSGKVSPVQELQLTTCGQNIRALEVKGNFDDCQAMVKQAFMDEDLNKKYNLTSANSINVARWLPQQLYYFFAYRQRKQEEPPVICVPSGNFGNICAGILAYTSGLPVKHFIAACNSNDTIPRFLATDDYAPKPAVATISNAMDVSNPSNFVRILELFAGGNTGPVSETGPVLSNNIFSSVSVSDEITKQTIKEVFEKYNYTLDPHGAVGYYALNEFLNTVNSQRSTANGQRSTDGGIFLETAHPVKFPEVVEEMIGKKIEIPENVRPLFSKEKQSVVIGNEFSDLKEWMF